MPNILANKKSLKKDKKRNLFKFSYKKKLKQTIKTSLTEKNISPIYKSLDSQLSKGLIKKNRCNKLKSRYMCALNKLNEQKS